MTFENSFPKVRKLSATSYLFVRWFLEIITIFPPDIKHAKKPFIALSPPKNDTTAAGGSALPTIRQEGKKFRQYASALSATVGPFAVGTVLAWMSPAMPMLLSPTSKIKVTPNQGSWVGSLIAIGAIFGSIPAGKCADIFGRKPVILCLTIPFITSWTIIYFATDVWMLYVARLIAGSCLGGITATVPMYIGEIAESSIRGELCSYVQLNVTLGILYVYAIGPFVNYYSLAIMCGILPLIWFVFGFIGDTRIAYVPIETWQEGRRRKSVGVVARKGLRYCQRNGDSASTHRGVEAAHRQVQGYDIVQSHDPCSNHRLGTAKLLVVFGHKRANILRTVHIRDQQLQCVSETLLRHHWNPSSHIHFRVFTTGGQGRSASTFADIRLRHGRMSRHSGLLLLAARTRC
ncbi:unnamed protein product [Aphis gossypii]|uniref:Major facilitator superfamily (MFS) profile domain-containing protein n=1 Tax=Aphis gossypii TaxID=80765 RepID=A0A9P0IP80_APHGO|nr:unnamed protein product [Aphis gossypii]